MTAPAPAAEPAPRVARPRRRLYWLAVVAALTLTITGGGLAWNAYSDSGGPAGAVRGYYAALQRGNAPVALAYGAVPAGSRTLLTSAVLRAQNAAAPITGVRLGAVRRTGPSATVQVTYTLRGRKVGDTVRTRQRAGDWQLTRAAVPVEISVTGAADRVTIAGAAVPEGAVAVFPGALAARFDSPYLTVDPGSDQVRFADVDATVAVAPQVSAAGRSAARAAVLAALRRCLDSGGRTDLNCPQRNDRDVPGSLRGTLVAPQPSALHVAVGSDVHGLLTVTGGVRVRGSYRTLDFDDVAQAKHGTFNLPIAAQAYAVGPLVVTWTRP